MARRLTKNELAILIQRVKAARFGTEPPDSKIPLTVGQEPSADSSVLRNECEKAEAWARAKRDELLAYYRRKAAVRQNEDERDDLIYHRNGRLYVTGRGAVELLHIRRDVISIALKIGQLTAEKHPQKQDEWVIDLDDLEKWLGAYEANRDQLDLRDPRLPIPKRLLTDAPKGGV